MFQWQQLCTKPELRLHHPCLLRFIAEQQELALGCCKAPLTQCLQFRKPEQSLPSLLEL